MAKKMFNLGLLFQSLRWQSKGIEAGDPYLDRSAARRQREGGMVSVFWNFKAHHQWHTFNKATSPNAPDRSTNWEPHSNIWVCGVHSHLNYHVPLPGLHGFMAISYCKMYSVQFPKSSYLLQSQYYLKDQNSRSLVRINFLIVTPL